MALPPVTAPETGQGGSRASTSVISSAPSLMWCDRDGLLYRYDLETGWYATRSTQPFPLNTATAATRLIWHESSRTLYCIGNNSSFLFHNMSSPKHFCHHIM
jgi:hypothetical protein